MEFSSEVRNSQLQLSRVSKIMEDSLRLEEVTGALWSESFFKLKTDDFKAAVESLRQDSEGFQSLTEISQKLTRNVHANSMLRDVYCTLAQRNQLELQSKEDENRRLSRRIDDLNSTIKQLVNKNTLHLDIKEKYDKLELKFLQLVEHLKQQTLEKKMLEQAIQSQQEKINKVSEIEQLLRICEKKLADALSDVRERDAHIAYIRNEHRKVEKLNEIRTATSTIYESMMAPLATGIRCVHEMISKCLTHLKLEQRLFSFLEDGPKFNLQADPHCISELKEKRAFIMAGENLSLESKDQAVILQALDLLLQLPALVERFASCADSVHDLKGLTSELQVEIENLKLFSSKERRRLAQHYEDQILLLKDVKQKNSDPEISYGGPQT
jgi:hypothetical protein